MPPSRCLAGDVACGASRAWRGVGYGRTALRPYSGPPYAVAKEHSHIACILLQPPAPHPRRAFRRGSFATARLATNKETGEKVAIKTLMRNHENFDKDLCESARTRTRKLAGQGWSPQRLRGGNFVASRSSPDAAHPVVSFHSAETNTWTSLDFAQIMMMIHAWLEKPQITFRRTRC